MAVPVSKFPLTVFFDGSCGVCAAEMTHYQGLDRQSRLRFVDIRDEAFDPGESGPSREDFMRQLHVRDATGSYFKGVDGFAAIWSALPGPRLQISARLIKIPLIHGLARLGYWLFARLRHLLPRAASRCDADACSFDRHPKGRNR